MAIERPFRDLSDRYKIGQLFVQRAQQQCTRSIKPFFCQSDTELLKAKVKK